MKLRDCLTIKHLTAPLCPSHTMATPELCELCLELLIECCADCKGEKGKAAACETVTGVCGHRLHLCCVEKHGGQCPVHMSPWETVPQGEYLPSLDTMPDLTDLAIDGLMRGLDCSICLAPMKDPVTLIECGHNFCETCVQQLHKSETPRCPLDRISIGKQFVPAFALREIIGNVNVKCPGKKCTFVGENRDLEYHIEQCPHVKLRCRHRRCNKRGSIGQIRQHDARCSYRCESFPRLRRMMTLSLKKIISNTVGHTIGHHTLVRLATREFLEERPGRRNNWSTKAQNILSCVFGYGGVALGWKAAIKQLLDTKELIQHSEDSSDDLYYTISK